MKSSLRYLPVLAAAALLAAVTHGLSRPLQAADVAAPQNPKLEDCASDPKVLGLERIVEIDAAQGPIFGGSHRHETFLHDKEVILTFDDGPMRHYTRPVLKALADHCTKATFFMVGRMAAADPALVKEVLAAGHTVGSHTWSHQNLKVYGQFKARTEFELGLSAVTAAAGQPIAPFFRFPYLSSNRLIQDYVGKRQSATFFIDIDSKDFQTRNSNRVYDKIMRDLSAQGKGVILMHDIQPSTAGMIKRLLDTLHEKGYKVVHVVPKAKATTVADFDTRAEKLVAAKARKIKDEPMADRSMVWTMPPPDKVKPPKLRRSGGSSVASGSADKPSAASSSPEQMEVLPWSNTMRAAARRGTDQRQRVGGQPESSTWQFNTFQN